MAEEKPKQKKLTPAQRIVVVRSLARFMTPTEVAEMIKEEFGVELSRQAVEKYDPTKGVGANLNDELVTEFTAAREAFVAEINQIDVAHQSFRLRELSRLYHAAKRKKDVIAAQFLEQAAKEVGGYYTNRRELTGKNGGPIEQSHRLDLSKLNEGELDILERILSKTSDA